MNTLEKLSLILKENPKNDFFISLRRFYSETGKLTPLQIQAIDNQYLRTKVDSQHRGMTMGGWTGKKLDDWAKIK
jgi:hypothetical protein